MSKTIKVSDSVHYQ